MKEYSMGMRNRLSDFLRVLSDELYVDDGIGDVINADTHKICCKLYGHLKKLYQDLNYNPDRINEELEGVEEVLHVLERRSWYGDDSSCGDYYSSQSEFPIIPTSTEEVSEIEQDENLAYFKKLAEA